MPTATFIKICKHRVVGYEGCIWDAGIGRVHDTHGTAKKKKRK